MFQFTPLASSRLWIQRWMTGYDPCRVSPFGHRRITGCVLLPDAYRSLPRPSSPVRAKAFPVRPCTLDRNLSIPHSKPYHATLRLLVLASSSLTQIVKFAAEPEGPCR